MTKCHNGHGYFGEVMESFLDSKKKSFKKRWPPTNFEKKKPLPDEILYLSHLSHPPDKTIFSSGASCITVADKLIEMVQYSTYSHNLCAAMIQLQKTINALKNTYFELKQTFETRQKDLLDRLAKEFWLVE